MSAAMAIERELGAEARTFATVAGALLWYAAQRARRLRMAIPLERGTDPKNRAEIEREEATYAKIVGCLVAHAPEDWDSRYEIESRDVDLLIAFYDSTTEESNDSLQALARRADMTVAGFLSHKNRTRNVIRRRMEERGLIAP